MNAVTGLSLSIEDREHRAGGLLSVNLVAEDESRRVVIENQLEQSDHDHLGKLITYLTTLEAKTAIWIVPKARSEHISAMSRLNEKYSATSFYLISLEVFRIGDSLPAPLLTQIVGPSEESKEIDKTKEEAQDRNNLRFQFWTQLLNLAREKTPLHAKNSPQGTGYIRATMASGLYLRYGIQKNAGDVKLYIDRGGDSDSSENSRIYDVLAEAKEEIEESFGEPLEWQRLDGKRACHIGKNISVGGYRDDETKWAEIQETMIDAMIRLGKAFKTHIDRLQL